MGFHNVSQGEYNFNFEMGHSEKEVQIQVTRGGDEASFGAVLEGSKWKKGIFSRLMGTVPSTREIKKGIVPLRVGADDKEFVLVNVVGLERLGINAEMIKAKAREGDGDISQAAYDLLQSVMSDAIRIKEGYELTSDVEVLDVLQKDRFVAEQEVKDLEAIRTICTSRGITDVSGVERSAKLAIAMMRRNLREGASSRGFALLKNVTLITPESGDAFIEHAKVVARGGFKVVRLGGDGDEVVLTMQLDDAAKKELGEARLEKFIREHDVTELRSTNLKELRMLLDLAGEDGIAQIKSFVCLEGGVVKIAQERYVGDGVDLWDKREISLLDKLKIFRGGVKGLERMHAKRYVHRDVKFDNVLFKGLEGVLTDFGFSCRLSETAELKRVCGSPSYISPEMLSSFCIGKPTSVDEKTDIWSIGVVLYRLANEKFPATVMQAIEDCVAEKERLMGAYQINPGRYRKQLQQAQAKFTESLRSLGALGVKDTTGLSDGWKGYIRGIKYQYSMEYSEPIGNPRTPKYKLDHIIWRCLRMRPADRPSAAELGAVLDEIFTMY
jgi:serine/threonine protein kinase